MQLWDWSKHTFLESQYKVARPIFRGHSSKKAQETCSSPTPGVKFGACIITLAFGSLVTDDGRVGCLAGCLVGTNCRPMWNHANEISLWLINNMRPISWPLCCTHIPGEVQDLAGVAMVAAGGAYIHGPMFMSCYIAHSTVILTWISRRDLDRGNRRHCIRAVPSSGHAIMEHALWTHDCQLFAALIHSPICGVLVSLSHSPFLETQFLGMGNGNETRST